MSIENIPVRRKDDVARKNAFEQRIQPSGLELRFVIDGRANRSRAAGELVEATNDPCGRKFVRRILGQGVQYDEASAVEDEFGDPVHSLLRQRFDPGQNQHVPAQIAVYEPAAFDLGLLDSPGIEIGKFPAVVHQTVAHAVEQPRQLLRLGRASAISSQLSNPDGSGRNFVHSVSIG